MGARAAAPLLPAAFQIPSRKPPGATHPGGFRKSRDASASESPDRRTLHDGPAFLTHLLRLDTAKSGLAGMSEKPMLTCLTRFAHLGRRHDTGSPWSQPPNPPGGARRAVVNTSQRVLRFDAPYSDHPENGMSAGACRFWPVSHDVLASLSGPNGGCIRISASGTREAEPWDICRCSPGRLDCRRAQRHASSSHQHRIRHDL